MKNKLPQNFCILPWTAMEVQPNGTVKPCCMYKDTLKDPNGQEYLIQKDDINDILNSEELNEIKQRFLSGTQPRGCHRCWMEEISGKDSKRIRDNQKYKHLIKEEVVFDEAKPRYLDLKLGNICNLKCRICGPQYSSKWITEKKRYDKLDGIVENYERLDWPEKSEKFWETVESLIPNLEHLDFTGGEPFMISQHFDLLEKIVASGRANKISLHYNSNGTQLPMKALKEIWPNFKYVDVHFSIDGIDKHFEYQRHPAKWQDALATMSVFKQYTKPNFDIKICHTVNIFNVFYLPEFLNWAREFGMSVYLNNLHEPKYYNISSIPYTAKVKIQKKLEDYSGQNLNSVINFMMNSNTQSQFMTFESHIKRMDIVRQESFAATFPELALLYKGVTV
jgi:MoaA/NifB/PqqE/SkfB family radical SAM enzyme